MPQEEIDGDEIMTLSSVNAPIGKATKRKEIEENGARCHWNQPGLNSKSALLLSQRQELYLYTTPEMYFFVGCGKPSQEYYHVPADWLEFGDATNIVAILSETGRNPSEVTLVNSMPPKNGCSSSYQGTSVLVV